jgi:seryl-tRNA synthetase
MSPEELQVIQIAVIVLLSIIALYQNQFLRKVIKERNSLREKIYKIQHDIDEIMNIKRTAVVELKNEIEKLSEKAKYIADDQIELDKEYEYLQKRNKNLEEIILRTEERLRNNQDV